MANQQSKTIFDAKVTTVESAYGENGAFGTIPVDYAPIFNGGESVRLTVNGVSRVYVAVDSSDIYTSAYIGNKWLPQRSANTAVEDDGSDYYISTSTGLAATNYFYSRNPGIYQLKIEIIPLTAPTIDPLSMWLGWKVGNWVARQRGKRQEPQTPVPVAYLYNGVRLPDINTVWTDEMKALYPYAYMYEVAGFGAYMIIFASFEMYKDGKQIFAKTAGEAIYAMYLPGAYDDWESDGIEQEVKENELMFDEEAEVQAFTAVSWTSHDILNADGTVYLAASEPVPVYE